MKNESRWISSKEVQRTVNIKGCELMHYRIQNKLEFKMEGNTYLYSLTGVEKLNLIINNMKKNL